MTVFYLVMVLLAIAYLISVIREGPDEKPRWWLLGLVIIWLGDALLGENRPPIERAAKGALALLIGTGLAITVRRRHRSPHQPSPVRPEQGSSAPAALEETSGPPGAQGKSVPPGAQGRPVPADARDSSGPADTWSDSGPADAEGDSGPAVTRDGSGLHEGPELRCGPVPGLGGTAPREPDPSD